MGRRDRERSASLTAPDAPASEPLHDESEAPAPADAPDAPAPEADAVAAPEPPAPTRYRVRGPALVYAAGRLAGPGKVLDLTPAEAASLADYIDPVP